MLNPIHYNPLIAHASNPKAALVFGFLNEIEGTDESVTTVRFSDVSAATTLSDFEVKAAINVLNSKQAFQSLDLNSQGFSYGNIELKGLLTEVQTKKSLSNAQLYAMLVNNVTIERWHADAFQRVGLSINSTILLSILLEYVHRTSLVNAGKSTSEWFPAAYDLWVELSGLTLKQIKVSKAALISIKVLESNQYGKPKVYENRINFDAMSSLMNHQPEHLSVAS